MGRAESKAQATWQYAFPDFSEEAWRLFHEGSNSSNIDTAVYASLRNRIKTLAQGLDKLSTTVRSANRTLHDNVGPELFVTWDKLSMVEIIGNYEATLLQCSRILITDPSYGKGHPPSEGELSRSEIERLQQILEEHSLRLDSFHKPFEIDLLYRIRILLRQTQQNIKYEENITLGNLSLIDVTTIQERVTSCVHEPNKTLENHKDEIFIEGNDPSTECSSTEIDKRTRRDAIEEDSLLKDLVQQSISNTSLKWSDTLDHRSSTSGHASPKVCALSDVEQRTVATTNKYKAPSFQDAPSLSSKDLDTSSSSSSTLSSGLENENETLRPFEWNTRFFWTSSERSAARNHNDVPLAGIFVTDLDKELQIRDIHHSISKRVPDAIQRLDDSFSFSNLISFPEDQEGILPATLPELCHAFVHNLELAHRHLQPEFPHRPAASSYYLDLLGCTWIFLALENLSSKESFDPDSHWQSYIRRLEEAVEEELHGFSQILVLPSDDELHQVAQLKIRGFEPSYLPPKSIAFDERMLQKYDIGQETFASIETMKSLSGPRYSHLPLALVDSVMWTWELPAFIDARGETPGSGLGSEVIIALNSTSDYQTNDEAYADKWKLSAITLKDWLDNHLAPSWKTFFEDFLRGLEASLGDSNSRNFSVHLVSQGYSWKLKWTYDQERLHLLNPPPRLGQELLELIELVGWFCRAVRVPRGAHHFKLTKAVYRLDTRTIRWFGHGRRYFNNAVRPVILLEEMDLPEGNHNCWKKLFKSCTIADCRCLERRGLTKALEQDQQPPTGDELFGKGLKTSFDLLVSLSAVEYPVVVDEGVVLVGYDVILIPTAISKTGNAAQFHVITTAGDAGSQINPYNRDLGPRLFTKDIKQFRQMRCFLGWCESAQINLGTRQLPADVGYSGCVEKGKSLYLDGFESIFQLGMGGSGPLSAVLGLQTNFKYASHHRQFTPFGGFQKLLLDTAHEVVAMYDSGKRRSWLVPKLSVLLHMAQAYTRSYAGTMANDVPYVSGHTEALNLIGELTNLGDKLVFSNESAGGEPGAQRGTLPCSDGLVLRQLLLGFNINLLKTVAAVQNSSGKKLYGFEFMDVVTTPGRGTCMKAVSLASSGRQWIGLVNQVDAIIVCSDIGQVITPTADLARRNQGCNSLPVGRDYLAAMLPCLRRLARRRGDEALLSSSTMGPNSSHIQGMKVTEDSFWYVQGDPFHGCQHEVGSDDTCWNRKGFLQHLKSQSYLSRRLSIVKRQNEPRCSPTCTVPQGGAVVFGRGEVPGSRSVDAQGEREDL